MAENNPVAGVNFRMVIHGEHAGYQIEFELFGRPDMIPAAVARLRELGVTAPRGASAPVVQVAPAVAANGTNGTNGKAPRPAGQLPEPYYDKDGNPCCPWHKTELREGRFGLYCSSRAEGDQSNAKGYCKFSVRD
jgi:hypothetical protein